jgi:hypothetical protein
VKNETMGDKTLGGEKKFSVCLKEQKNQNDWCKEQKNQNDWCKEQKNQKDRITYVDKSTHHVC